MPRSRSRRADIPHHPRPGLPPCPICTRPSVMWCVGSVPDEGATHGLHVCRVSLCRPHAEAAMFPEPGGPPVWEAVRAIILSAGDAHPAVQPMASMSARYALWLIEEDRRPRLGPLWL